MKQNIAITIVGLGYVGLPLAAALGRKFSDVRGFDVDAQKISLISKGIDPTGENLSLSESSLTASLDPATLATRDLYIIAVPTPVDENRNPDLKPLFSASKSIAPFLGKRADGSIPIVCFESTVYPGLTEEVLIPYIEKLGKKNGVDFWVGYSPERINPGDSEHSLERVIKVVSGQNEQVAQTLRDVYGAVVKAGIHIAPTIRVAEAAKVIENTQRDLNIALMNELAIIFDKLSINTNDVLAAAGTKWNFLKFTPGLVGGHCIGVDPYYLTTKAQSVGYHPEVILAGRRINDSMGRFIAQRTVKLMINNGINPNGAVVGVLGVTFKENVTDTRNSRVPDIITELKEFGVTALVYDPLANAAEAKHEYGIELVEETKLTKLDGIIAAVSHKPFTAIPLSSWASRVKSKGVFVDVKSAWNKEADTLPSGINYWAL